MTLSTSGLGPGGRRELEMVGVPREAANEAASVVRLIAQYLANHRPAHAGEIVAVETSLAHVVVRLIEPPAEGGGPRSVRASLPALRIVAPDPNAPLDAPPADAIATLILERAQRALADENEEARERELLRAIALFPGEPARRNGQLYEGVRVNRENHLAYFMLACRCGRAGSGLYRSALMRSNEFEERELGATHNELQRLDGGAIARLARQILRQNLGTSAVVERAGPSVAVLLSPFWRKAQKGRVSRESALLPLAALSLYYSGNSRRELEHPETPALVAAAVLAQLAEPCELLVATWPARIAWLDPDAPLMTTSLSHEPAYALVSAVLAAIAYFAAAGAERPEIHAALGLGKDARTQALLESRLVALENEIQRWQTDALSDGFD